MSRAAAIHMNELSLLHKNPPVDSWVKGDTAVICFPCAQWLRQGRRLAEALDLLEVESDRIHVAEKIAAELGPYQLDEGLQRKLQRAGVALRPGGVLPYTAPLDWLESFRALEAGEDDFWTAADVVGYVRRHHLEVLAWDFGQEVNRDLHAIFSRSEDELCWEAGLALAEVLEGHRVKQWCMQLRCLR